MQLLLYLRLHVSLFRTRKTSDHLISPDRPRRRQVRTRREQRTSFCSLATLASQLRSSAPQSRSTSTSITATSAPIALPPTSKVSRVSTRGAPVARLPPPSRTVRLGQGLSALASWTAAGAGRDQANETPVTLAAAFVQSARFKLNSLPLDHHLFRGTVRYTVLQTSWWGLELPLRPSATCV